jgi:hypothetical protein
VLGFPLDEGSSAMSEPPPNRNPAFQAVLRRLLARRPQPTSAPGKSQARPSAKKKSRAA